MWYIRVMISVSVVLNGNFNECGMSKEWCNDSGLCDMSEDFNECGVREDFSECGMSEDFNECGRLFKFHSRTT